MQHVVIAGGGIIGLSCALELARIGLRVTVLEQGRVMEGASWAAAGMLAVEDPENSSELLPFARFSRLLYPEFSTQIEQLSGLRVPLRTTRTLQGKPGGKDFALCALPGLRTGKYGFTLLEESSLDPRDLCAALPRAVRATGVVVREGISARSIRRTISQVFVELSNGMSLTADDFLLTGGAWSGLFSVPGIPALPVAPRKGQMIEVTLRSPALPFVIRTPELYLVPRGDGRVVIGATVEHAGFNRSVDEEAGNRLWEEAGALWPPILEGRITARWTGLRPGYREGWSDTLPLVGKLDERVWIATGHFRNGILLAPGTAHVLRELLGGQQPSVDLAAFSPQRFLQPADIAG